MAEHEIQGVGPVTDPAKLDHLRKRFEKMPDSERKKQVLAKLDSRKAKLLEQAKIK